MSTKIEWAQETWNCVWGCKNNCPYCYARKIAKRFGKKVCGRDDFVPTWVQKNFDRKFPKKPCRIFVNSMSDIAYWRTEWMNKVIHKIETEYPQHTFMFLTKRPEVYEPHGPWPLNCWLGVTVNGMKDIGNMVALDMMDDRLVKFVSYEPILANEHIPYGLDWLILGLETGRKNIFVPDKAFIVEMVNAAQSAGTKIFMKDSMSKCWDGELIREFPNV